MGVRVVLAALWLAWGCGRVGYDPEELQSQVDGGGGVADGGADAAADAGPVQETWTLSEAPGATLGGVTADTWACDGIEQDNNWGASPLIDSGPGCTGLLRFDLTPLPSGARVLEATVAVWPQVVPTTEGQVDVHRVLEEWAEGSLEGEPGEANYNLRLPGVAWTTRGAKPPGSSEQAPLHTFHPGVYEAQLIPLPAAVVQAWLDDPATNHGISFFGSTDYGPEEEEHPHFLSSKSSQAALRPALTVTFELE